MKFGKVFTYKDVDEAKKLIGKRVVYSNCFKSINNFQDCLGLAMDFDPLSLNEVSKDTGLYYPFRLSDGKGFQFIREIIDDKLDKSQYKPYDLSDPKVRDSMRGEWFRDTRNDGDSETEVFSFCHNESGWSVNAKYYADSFLRDCVWVDNGLPCGRLTNMEVR